MAAIEARRAMNLAAGGTGLFLRAGRTAVRCMARLLGLGGLMAAAHPAAHAVELPADRAEAMFHLYDADGLRTSGPALLVRKRLLDTVSLSGGYYVDAVSNASIDVVTSASKFSETRQQTDLGIDYAVRDTLVRVSATRSEEPDYQANTFGGDVSSEMFGGMTTLSLGFSEGHDRVGQKGSGWIDAATHWQYRLGLTQVLTPRWVAGLNLEALNDEGYLGNPYRVARVFGAAVPERVPRTRSARVMKLRAQGDVSDWFTGGLWGWGAGQRHAVHAEYRYFWDNWGIKAHTLEGGYSRYFGDAWLVDTYARFNRQDGALFYSDNAEEETPYISRNRQLSSFNTTSLGGKVSYTWREVPGSYTVKLHAAYELMHFDYQDFTDIRTGKPYAFNGHLLQFYVTANF